VSDSDGDPVMGAGERPLSRRILSKFTFDSADSADASDAPAESAAPKLSADNGFILAKIAEIDAILKD
jgi:hypothetical protein